MSLITPNSWLKNIRMINTRRFILNNLNLISINPNISSAFEEAHVDTLIFIAFKDKLNSNISTCNVWYFDDKGTYRQRHIIEQSRFCNNDGLVFDIEANNQTKSILNKVRNNSINLEELFEITRGVNPYEIGRASWMERV